MLLSKVYQVDHTIFAYVWCVNTEIFSFITTIILMSAFELRRKKWERWKFVGNSALSWRHTRFCDAARPETLAGNNLLAVWRRALKVANESTCC